MLKKIFLLFFSLCNVLYNNCISQEIQSYRYEFRADALIEKAEKSPKNKEMIEKQIKAFSPQFIDLILINNDLIELKWSYSNQLSSITIYSFQKKKIYKTLANNELTIESFEVDTSNHISITQLNNDTTNLNSVWSYELDSPNAMPVFFNTTSKIDSLSNINVLTEYPEYSVILNYKIFPSSIIFGKPKTFQSYILKKDVYHHKNILSKDYQEYIENIENPKIRLKFRNIISFAE